MSKNRERDHEIFEKRKLGDTLRSLAKEYGLSHQRVDQICKKRSSAENYQAPRYDYAYNKNLLKSYIIRHGDTMSDAAGKIGISYQSFMRKLNGIVDFRVREMTMLRDAYEISAEDFEQIFFCDK